MFHRINDNIECGKIGQLWFTHTYFVIVFFNYYE